MSEPKVLEHLNPVWRDRADFIVHAVVDDEALEQLWARQLDDRRFEVCCIPMFVYDIALGDIVETQRVGDREYVVASVEPRGRYAFRVSFSESPDRGQATEQLLSDLGDDWLLEWYSETLLGLDAPDPEKAQELADLLQQLEDQGLFIYETARS
jgi:Domain of unknown function (DUF4265)